MKAGLILRVVWVVGGRTGDAAGPQALKADARAGPPTLYGQYVRVPEGVALPHVLPVQGLGAAPSAVPRGGVARDHLQWRSVMADGRFFAQHAEERFHVPLRFCAGPGARAGRAWRSVEPGDLHDRRAVLAWLPS